MVAGEANDTRARLLEHARAVYLEDGAANFSLREVARRVGISAAAVYRHFDDKEALLVAVCEEGFRTFSTYLLRALRESTPLGRLRAAGDSYLRFALENPHDYRFIFMSPVKELGFEGSAPPRDTESTFQFLVDRVRDCIDAGIFAADGEPAELAMTIWAHVHGLASLRLSGHLEPVGDDAHFSAFFRGSVDQLLSAFER